MACLRVQLIRFAYVASSVAYAALLQGCAGAPPQRSAPLPQNSILLPAPGPLNAPTPVPEANNAGGSVGSEIVIRAISLLGAPYKFGGHGPRAFDCSGLVSFIHEEIGIDVPRTAAEQYRAATPVSMNELEPGDLLFFKTRGSGISHVAIYAGSNRFVHAPQTGQSIELRTLDDGYYKHRLVGAGRLF